MNYPLRGHGSSVRCPAMGADHPLPPECHDDQQRLEDVEFCRAPWKDWVDCKRQTANGREFQWKNEYLKTSVWTGNDINLFSLEALVCRDETERWSREKGESLFNALWKKTVKRVFTTIEQGQPTKFVKQTSDRSCKEIIFFDKTGSTALNSVRVTGYLWPYMGPTLQRHTPSGDELRTDK